MSIANQEKLIPPVRPVRFDEESVIKIGNTFYASTKDGHFELGSDGGWHTSGAFEVEEVDRQYRGWTEPDYEDTHA